MENFWPISNADIERARLQKDNRKLNAEIDRKFYAQLYHGKRTTKTKKNRAKLYQTKDL